MATNSAGGCPESAWVNLAALGDGRPVFGTNERSRKFENLLADPLVSLVVVSGTGQELQLEGEAVVLGGPAARSAGELLEARHPGATGKPSTRFVAVLLRWGRFVDVAAEPPLREEFVL